MDEAANDRSAWFELVEGICSIGWGGGEDEVEGDESITMYFISTFILSPFFSYFWFNSPFFHTSGSISNDILFSQMHFCYSKSISSFSRQLYVSVGCHCFLSSSSYTSNPHKLSASRSVELSQHMLSLQIVFTVYEPYHYKDWDW